MGYGEDTPAAWLAWDRMRRTLPSLFLLLSVLAMASPAHAQGSPSSFGSSPVPGAETPLIDVIKVEGSIDRPLLGFVSERLDSAVADGAIVVLELDTAGTIDEDGFALAERIANLPVPVISWVGPVPARASGAGMLLMDASSLAAVAPGSQTGPLLPLDLLHPDAVPADLNAAIDDWISSRGRAVDRSVEEQALAAQSAIDAGLADETAPSVLDLLNAIDGERVQTPGGPVTLDTKIATTDADVQAGKGVSIQFEEIGPVRRVEHAVATPSMVYLLLVLGLAGLAFELTQPGFGFAGSAGIVLVALAVYGITVAPPSVIGIVVLLGGIGLLALDVVLRRLGALTLLGLVAFVAGSLLVYDGVSDAIRISPWLIGGLTIGSLLYYGFGLTVALQSRDRIRSTQRGLIGLVGEARGRLAPDGPVFVKGSLWRGRSTGRAIQSGSRVRVRGVDGMILKVEEEPEDPNDVDDLPEPLPAND
jgi:membrane-bound serine protease (ClpP class)